VYIEDEVDEGQRLDADIEDEVYPQLRQDSVESAESDDPGRLAGEAGPNVIQEIKPGMVKLGVCPWI